MTPEQVADLDDRLENAVEVLNRMAAEKAALFPGCSDYDRLRGKATGVQLALSYLREYL